MVHAIHEAQNTSVLYISFKIFINTQPFKNWGTLFDKESIDDKSEVRFEKHPLVAVLKLKM